LFAGFLGLLFFVEPEKLILINERRTFR